jgi:hypothetical protein
MILILVFLGIVSLLILSLSSMRKQVIKDWNTLKELKAKLLTVSTKVEIEEFHKEFVEKTKEIHNTADIQRELLKIDAYLRGMYKQFKQ